MALPDSWQTAQLAGLLEIPEGQRVLVMEQRSHSDYQLHASRLWFSADATD
ncbi:hypothetical protein [Brenneria goodwinii]|uniref:hypothetical protein n=1 Tax=Brenneria goodwinii TaxID=1109412 RepID=UPI0036E19BC6